MLSRVRLGLIAYEYPPLIGGMGTYACALSRHMHDAGYDVHVFANEQAEPVSDGVHVHPILTTDLARDLPRLRRYSMNLWHAINFGYAPLACLKRPFLLTVHGTDFLTPWVGWKMDRWPLLWRMSGMLQRERWRRLLAIPGLRCVDDIMTCSRFSAMRFREAYPAGGRISIIPNGVDDAFDRISSTQPGRQPQRVLTVCNLDTANRRKNVDGCLQAMALVGDRLNLEYRIVGDGADRAALEQLAGKLNVSDRVTFLGRLSRDELINEYASASLFTLVPCPKQNDIEGFGIVYLEAAMSGVPSLAGRYGGAEEAVEDGVSGFFARDASPESIADAWSRFFQGDIRFDESRVRLHARGYSWSKVLRRVEQLYARHVNPPVRRETSCDDAESPLHPEDSKRKRQMIECTPAVEEKRFTAKAANVTAHSTYAADRPAEGRSWASWVTQTPPGQITGERAGRLLLISYTFPPTGGSGVQRAAKLVRDLSSLGWEIEVLTAAHDRFPWRDDSLLEEIPRLARVHRVCGWEPANAVRGPARCLSKLPLVRRRDARTPAGTDARVAECTDASVSGTDARSMVNMDGHHAVSTEARDAVGTDASALPFAGTHPGSRHGRRLLRWMEDGLYWRLCALTRRLGWGQGESLWIGPATRAALRMHRRAPFDAVISTGPPHFVHHVARRFTRTTGVPWLADLRDPLVSDFERQPQKSLHIRRMRHLEGDIMNLADAVVTTCPALADAYRHKYPQRDGDSITPIMNGFDKRDLAPLVKSGENTRGTDVCTFMIAGAMYGRRTLANLVEPLQRVLMRRPELTDRVKLVMAGTLDQEQRAYWEQQRPDFLELPGYLDHTTALRRLLQAHCAVVIVPECHHGRLSIPGKTFELLALPVHLLALVPPGSDTDMLVREHAGVTTQPFENPEAIERAMEAIIDATFAGTLDTQRDWSKLDALERRETAVHFDRVLKRITSAPAACPSHEHVDAEASTVRKVGVA